MKRMRRNKGQGMVEYGLIMALVTLIIVGVLLATGDHVSDIIQQFSDTLAEGGR